MATLPEDVIHSVTNPLPRFTGGIHIYGGDFFDTARSQWDPETLREEPSNGATIREMFERENALRALSLPSLRGEDGLLRPTVFLVRSLVLIGAVLGVTAAFLRFVEHRPLSSVGLPPRAPWRRGLATGLLLGAAPVVILVGGLAATGHAEIGMGAMGLEDFIESWLPMVLGLALVSSLEELVLRGYGLQLLAEGAGRWGAAILTGALFGFMHAENPGANAAGLVNTAANGILLAWLVMRTGSLWMACAYHAGWNITGAMILGMRLSGLDHAGGVLVTRLSGPEWLTGGPYGFEGSVVIGLVEFAVLSVAVALAPRLPGHPDLVAFFGGETGPRGRAAGPL
ncbi:MAG: CPBP family intramembrane metalloprotease [Acidobacteria bacterium]|nr:CPBP family intramembrane metalloprotease [Acidobacteriota bacterium]